MKGIGLCAVFSRQGDWAFDYALALARHHKTRLNVFHFLESPYTLRRDVVFVDKEKQETAKVTPDLISKKDKELRETFDERLGDYVDVGFRLCEGADEIELRRCFRKGDYDILVIGYNARGASFGGTTTIEAFATEFKAPVILIGPDSPESFHLNNAAAQQVDDLMLADKKWEKITVTK
ncbi:MAG TPA: universal stress protein [Desulfomonilaceae bacterium]|nr:universal stress protein [Desulfomonilaceae bacterium]